MRCPYLEVEPVARCLAADGIRIVRDSELQNLCEIAAYAACRIYQRKKATSKDSQGKASAPDR